MKGFSISIPFGMVFKKYYCSVCGARLEKEKTHRVVTKEDKDYYQYHDYGEFPRRDYNVYDYRFMCPSCKARISYDEQCIVESIQKKLGRTELTSDEIKCYYNESKATRSKRALYNKILIPIIMLVLSFAMVALFAEDRTAKGLIVLTFTFVCYAIYVVISARKEYYGKSKRRSHQSYSHEKEAQMERLHAYSAHNEEMVKRSAKCYCFYCKGTFNSNEVVSYSEDTQSALCPRCNNASILPDSIEEQIDEQTISEMNAYWF